MKLTNITIFLLTVFSVTIINFPSTECSLVYIKENGYRQITVLLSDDIPKKERLAVVNAVKDLFELSSRVLYVATKRRAYFKEVVLLLPKSWNVKDLLELGENVTIEETNGGQEAGHDADVHISGELFRSSPHVLQAEGCGKQGTKVYLPTSFLLSEKILKDKSIEFVHYWAQYRYGVYSEGGFAYDERYPLYYSVPGTSDMQITACTNVQLNYTFTNFYGQECIPEVNKITGEPITENCFPVPVQQNVLSSIMYQQVIPNATAFCDSDLSLDKSHNLRAPSKHNILCSGESPWFIILRHPDFLKGRNQATRFKPQDLTFRYVQETNLHLVVVIDRSSNMQFKNLQHAIQNSLSKLILFDLPLETELGFVYFDVRATKGTMVKLMDDETKMEFLESELYQDAGTVPDSCPECGIAAGIELLEDERCNGLLLLLTTNSTLSNSDVLIKRLLTARIRFTAILLQNDLAGNQLDLDPLLQLSQAVKGNVFCPSHTDEGISLSQLYMSLVHAISHFERNSVQFLQDMVSDSTVTEFPFYVHESAAKDFIFLLTGSTFRAEESPFEEDETFLTSPSGKRVNLMKQYNIPALMYRTATAEVGEYTFTAKWKKGITDEVISIASGKPSDASSSLVINIWTNSRDLKVNNATSWKLFAEVKYGIHAIVGAEVIATIFDSYGIPVSTFRLLDTGFGDPDVTLHDGIYSRYIKPLNSSGLYNIFVRVTDSLNRSRISYISPEACCGSYIKARRTQPTGIFQIISGPILLHVKGSSLDDIYPPNRILDFRVVGMNLTARTYTLSWTSAGDDYDHGSAVAYRLKLFAERSEARWRFEKAGIVLDYNREIIQHSPPRDCGEPQNFEVQLPDTLNTGRYFLAIKATDHKNNIGPLSNIVEIYLRNDLRNWTIACDKNSNNGNSGFSFESCHVVYMLCWMLLWNSICNTFY